MSDSSSHSRRHSRHQKKRRTEYQDRSLVDTLQTLAEKGKSSNSKRTLIRTKYHCPRCTSDFLCLSRRKSLLDKIVKLFRLKTLRCEHCHKRYYRF